MIATAEHCDGIFSEVGSGKSLRSALDKREISYDSFYRLIDSDKQLAEQYARARRHQAESNQGRITAVVDSVLKGDVDPNAARVAIDALKWNAARMHPAIYGDKVQTQITGAEGGPVVMKWES